MTGRLSHWILISSMLVGHARCAGRGSLARTDAGASFDGGRRDAGDPDAAIRDGGLDAGRDAGRDGGPDVDGGVRTDGGSDASVDAGWDAGEHDAGTDDGGTGDGGMGDAGWDGGVTASVEIGTGETSFVPVATDDPVQIHRGPQGGHHIFVSVRAREVDPVNATISTSVRLDAGQVVCAQQFEGTLTLSGPWYEMIGLLCFVSDPLAVAGNAVVLTGRITDSHGRGGEAQVQAIAIAPP